MKKIYGGIYAKNPSVLTDQFLVDPEQQKADQLLLPYYLWETLAHVYMLTTQKILSKYSAKSILSALLTYIQKEEKGELVIDPCIGDVHENIEKKLFNDIHEDAGWLQLARSRNDQITTDQKLYVKKLLFDLFHVLDDCCMTLADKSTAYASTIMPGWTHTRVAMPSTFGFWWQSYLDQFITCEQALFSVFQITDTSPLGAGASYGVHWPIAPKKTQASLGFTHLFSNALAAIDDRGLHELYIAGIVTGCMTIVSRMMEDCIVMSMPEIGYITLDQSFTTGSSIMPQKINPDIAEKAKAKVGVVLGCLVTLCTVLKGTTHGMNRDSAETKPAIIKVMQTTIDTLHIVEQMIATVVPNAATMKSSVYPALATHLADSLCATHGIPFRQAHTIVGKAMKIHNHTIKQITAKDIQTITYGVTGKHITITKKFMQSALDVGNAVFQYAYSGTPNPVLVTTMTKQLLSKHEGIINQVTLMEKQWMYAKQQLLKHVQEFIIKEKI